MVVQMEGGPVLDMPITMFPEGIRAGDVVFTAVLNRTDTSLTLQLIIDFDESSRRASEATARLEKLRRQDPGGDIQI